MMKFSVNSPLLYLTQHYVCKIAKFSKLFSLDARERKKVKNQNHMYNNYNKSIANMRDDLVFKNVQTES